jgi:Zinc finger C-x8-C-x5-C-x3-H type (and similar)
MDAPLAVGAESAGNRTELAMPGEVAPGGVKTVDVHKYPREKAGSDSKKVSPMLSGEATASLPMTRGVRCHKGARHILYKTELCRSFQKTNCCSYGKRCQFAHGVSELVEPPRYVQEKRTRCSAFWTTG